MLRSRRFRTAWLALTAVTHLAIAVWIARDARRRGASPTPWALAALPAGLFALAGWRRHRPPLPGA
jgi:hypothetical protein